jgi:Ca-activated chloride channel family protein
MNVANILPGDRIEVEMKYTELLVPTDGIYDFVYPTVVGPRYSNQPAATAPASEKWVENPYLHEGEAAPYKFDIKVNLAAGMPIQKVSCRTHKTDISYDGKAVARVLLDPSEKNGGNRDYILKYQLAGGKIESGLLLYEGEKENFFLLMMQPPERVTPRDIPPREYIFIVDVSGSMHGFPLEISKELLKDLIGNLRPTDTFNVLLFAGGSQVMSERSMPATNENVRRAIDVIDRQRGGGGTELLPALKRALALPKNDENVSRTVVIATDGYVSVEKEAFDLIRNNLGEANMFTFGIGSSVNRFLLEGMARVGMGEPLVLTSPDQAKSRADEFRKLIQSPVLTDIEIDYGKFDVYDVEPPSIPDVLAERPVVVYGKWQGKPVGEISLKGVTGSRTYKERVDVYESKPLSANSALRYLWARRRIAVLDDYNNLSRDDERVKEVTSLGLTYNLLTAYTSFVAIDSEIRLKDGKAVTVKQPLPLPQGVSDYAVGKSGMRMAKPSRMKSLSFMGTPKAAPPSMPVTAGGAMGAEPEVDMPEEEKIILATVSIEKIEARGIDEKSVRTVMESKLSGIETCYNRAVNIKPGISGKIELKIEIDESGKVIKVTVVSSKLNDKDLEKCITEKIKKWRFNTGGTKATAKVTLSLTP